MLTDDLSDYATSDDEIERNLKESEGCEDDNLGMGESMRDSRQLSYTRGRRKIICRNKFQRTMSIREQWTDYTSKSCAENNL